MERLIGQNRAETLLARAVAADRVGHAYLFLGPTSSGKSTAARLFAQAMNCTRHTRQSEPASLFGSDTQHPTPNTLAPCGQCESCRRIAAGTHSEVMEVRPESKTGQNISIHQARDIRRNAALRPKVGRRRVYILANAEALNEEAANCLLKTLEEPSDFVTLILCAPSPSQVLPTIRSRCQIVRFGVAPPQEIAECLAARGVEAPQAQALARASGGRPGLALSWADDPSILEQRGRILDLFAAALRAQQKAAKNPGTAVLSLRLAEQLRALAGKEKDREKDDEDGPARPPKVIHSAHLEVGLSYLRDLLLLCEGASPELAQNQERLPEYDELCAAVEPGRTVTDIETVREAQQLLDRNVSPQLVLERMFWALIAGPQPRPERLF